MEYQIIQREKTTVAGLAVRTNNNDPAMQQTIGKLWKDFYEGGIYASIPEKQSSKPFGIYTDYASDETGAYTALVACETSDTSHLPDGVTACTIPAGRYARFIVRGNMVTAVSAFWQALWAMDLPRAFTCDSEEYQNGDMENTEIHMYISLKEESAQVPCIESRCGCRCESCPHKGPLCPGCTVMDKPFWGDVCPLKQCCEQKGLAHCGECDTFPCATLEQFAYDPKQGDDGARIQQCRAWKKEDTAK